MIGIDVVEIARFRRWLSGVGPEGWTQVFCAGELRATQRRRNPASGLAARFAAKEAVLKVLQDLDAFALDWREIEIVSKDGSAPSVLLHGEARALADERGIVDVVVSISHSRETAVAQAMAIFASAGGR